MPAWRLNDTDCHVTNFDIGASDGAISFFVAHVALCVTDQPRAVNVRTRNLATVHMGPPLAAIDQEIDIVATAGLDSISLRAGERRQIKLFVDERLPELKSQGARRKRFTVSEYREYVVHPPYVEPDDGVSLWRFSCVGFVVRAYEEANIFLVGMDDLPLVPLDVLKVSYPAIAHRLDKKSVRKHLGIGVGNSWPVVLPGYVINSLNRTPEEIRNQPFTPVNGDEYFPSTSGLGSAP